MIQIDSNSSEPIFRQLQHQIQQLISSGQWSAGYVLPSVRELAAALAVNPMTVSKTYSQLETDGWLQRSRGRPMQVADHVPDQEFRAQQWQSWQQHVAQLCRLGKHLALTNTEILAAVAANLEQDNE